MILEGHSAAIYKIIEMMSGMIASASADKTIRIWNIDNNNCYKKLEGHLSQVWFIIQLTNGCLASSSDSEVRIWDEGFNCINVLKGHTSFIYQLAQLNNLLLV